MLGQYNICKKISNRDVAAICICPFSLSGPGSREKEPLQLPAINDKF